MKLDFYMQTPESPFWKNGTPFGDALRLISSCGYDGVEFLPHCLEKMQVQDITRLTVDMGLEVICVATGFLNTRYGLSISHPNESARRVAVENVIKCIGCAADLNAKFVSIGLVRGKIVHGLSYERGLTNIAESLTECGDYAEERGIRLLVEPENSYETAFIHTVEESVDMLRRIGLGNLGLLIDSYHMNLEEVDIPTAMRAGLGRILHVHLADSNRLAPGMGHFDFRLFLEGLREIRYNSFLGIEVSPSPSLDIAIRESMAFIKRIT